MNILLEKLKEVLSAVLPVVALVILMNFAFGGILDYHIFIRFLFASFILIVGLAIFLFGIEQGISPIGRELGSAVTLKNSVWFLAVAGIVLGFLISIAEADLHILGEQVEAVTAGVMTKMQLVLVVSVGVAVFVSLGLLRILFKVRQRTAFTLSYILIGILAFLSTESFIAVAFDSSGATTGAITVPFILALAMGVSRMKKDSVAAESDSFGLVGMASAGAIVSVLFMSVFNRVNELSESGSAITSTGFSTDIFAPFAENFVPVIKDSALSLFPLVIVFLLANFIFMHINKKELVKILKGSIITLVGLFVFMLGVQSGFLDVGFLIGEHIGNLQNLPLTLLIGALIGMVVVLAEPAVYVLTHQIEYVTAGAIRRKLVLLFLAIGVSLFVMLSMLRIMLPSFKLWHILLPGYIISIILTFFVPDLFVGMAFDAGGVASGPMTATFILSFAQGLAGATPTAHVVIDGFGVIAAVALAPVLSLQILGLIASIKTKQRAKLEMQPKCDENFALLTILLPYGDARKVVEHAHKNGATGSTIVLARGTIRGGVLAFLGITETRKELILITGKQTEVTKIAEAVNEEFRIFEKEKKTGIAFIMPLEYVYTKRGSTESVFKPYHSEAHMNGQSAIFTIVNRGMANDVVDASLDAGARGGTILNARGSGATQTRKIFDIEIDPEKEIVLTIVNKEQVESVVQAIREKAQVEKEGHGILFVVPLEKTFGIK